MEVLYKQSTTEMKFNWEWDNSYCVIETNRKTDWYEVDFISIYQGNLFTFIFHVELSGQFLLF